MASILLVILLYAVRTHGALLAIDAVEIPADIKLSYTGVWNTDGLNRGMGCLSNAVKHNDTFMKIPVKSCTAPTLWNYVTHRFFWFLWAWTVRAGTNPWEIPADHLLTSSGSLVWFSTGAFDLFKQNKTIYDAVASGRCLNNKLTRFLCTKRGSSNAMNIANVIMDATEPYYYTTHLVVNGDLNFIKLYSGGDEVPKMDLNCRNVSGLNLNNLIACCNQWRSAAATGLAFTCDSFSRIPTEVSTTTPRPTTTCSPCTTATPAMQGHVGSLGSVPHTSQTSTPDALLNCLNDLQNARSSTVGRLQGNSSSMTMKQSTGPLPQGMTVLYTRSTPRKSESSEMKPGYQEPWWIQRSSATRLLTTFSPELTVMSGLMAVLLLVFCCNCLN